MEAFRDVFCVSSAPGPEGFDSEEFDTVGGKKISRLVLELLTGTIESGLIDYPVWGEFGRLILGIFFL